MYLLHIESFKCIICLHKPCIGKAKMSTACQLYSSSPPPPSPTQRKTTEQGPLVSCTCVPLEEDRRTRLALLALLQLALVLGVEVGAGHEAGERLGEAAARQALQGGACN